MTRKRKKSNSGPVGLRSAILALCVLAVVVGGIGLVSMKRGTSVNPHAAKTEKSGEGHDFGDLLAVRMDESIPSQIVDYTGFRVSFNSENRTPNWVSWELLADETDGSQSRSNSFWQDPDVFNCPQTSDYVRSGYDRGHLCPAADQKWSEKAMSDCFVMANMCPQDHSLNSGAWGTLENKERAWAKRDSALVIVAGPIYEDTDTKRIGQAGVRVPSAFFKVIIAPYLDTPRGIGFVYPNMSSPGNMQNYSMSIDEVERLTGLDFFHTLPDDIEDEVESKTSFKEWNYSK